MVKLFDLISGTRLRKKNVYFQYSFEEQFTGEYWVDGKKIYCKNVTTTVGNVNDELNAIGIDTLVYLFGTAKSNYNNTWLIPNAYNNEPSYNIYFNYTSSTKSMSISFGNYYGVNNVVVVTVKYTKN